MAITIKVDGAAEGNTAGASGLAPIPKSATEIALREILVTERIALFALDKILVTECTAFIAQGLIKCTKGAAVNAASGIVTTKGTTV